MRISTSLLLVLGCAAYGQEESKAESSPLDAYFAQVATDLRKKKAEFPDARSQARIAKVLAELDASAATTPVQATTEAAPQLTPKLLKTVIAAPCSVKGDVVSIAYTFQSAKELTDWDTAGQAPGAISGGVALSAASTMTHKVKFSSFELRGELALGNREGKHLGTLGGLEVTCSNYNAWSVNLLCNGQKYGSEVYDKDYAGPSEPNKFLTFSLGASKGVASLSWSTVKLGHAHAGIPDSVTLCGGNGGNKFRNLVITGTIDPDWLKAALARAPEKK